MELRWTSAALSDLVRLHDFLAPVNPEAASRVVQSLSVAPERLREHPHLGRKLDEFAAREVRRLITGNYEVRYEIVADTIYLLRIWHTREAR
jgi:plasmid stabilization system protein ParE